jgi:hypothetical protein
VNAHAGRDQVRHGNGRTQSWLMLSGGHVHSAAIPDLSLTWTLALRPLHSAPVSLSGTISFGTGPAMPVGIEAHGAPEHV